jgi:hypothetical protein
MVAADDIYLRDHKSALVMPFSRSQNALAEKKKKVEEIDTQSTATIQNRSSVRKRGRGVSQSP